MSATLERRYRRLLRAYPPAYRAERGDELLDTLLQLSPPDRSWPQPRQAAALLLAGMRMRTGANRLRGMADAWVDAARVAMVLILATDVVLQLWTVELMRADYAAGSGGFSPAVLVVSTIRVLLAIAAALALVRSHHRLAAVLVALVPVPAIVEAAVGTWDNAPPVLAVLWWLPVGGLMVPLLRRPAAPVSWRWLLPVPLLVVTSVLLPLFGQLLAALVLVVAAPLACLAWGAVVDPRPALGLGLFLLLCIPGLASEMAGLLIVVPLFGVAGMLLLTAGTLRAHQLDPAARRPA